MIKAIDKESINNICSGQVIFDLSIAVKELIENSIDAGATSIEIRLKEFGEETIEVIDNGSGIEPSNFEALTLKHYTSKLEKFDDLLTVETFGFRGEALSSLCALSDVCVTTRTSNFPIAQKLVFSSDGKIKSQSPIAREVGTTVKLSGLFKKLPVRYQEFKNNIKKEFTKLQNIIQAYALILTGKRIICYNQWGKSSRECIISTIGGNSTLRDNLTSVFGTEMNQSLDEFNAFDNLFKVNGLISKIGYGNGSGQVLGNNNGNSQSRSCKDRQFFFINGRPFVFDKLSKEITKIYRQFHKRGTYPVIIFNIQTPTDNYDINVTPDKRTIFIQKETQLLFLISDGLKTMWENVQSIFESSTPNSLTFDEENENENENDNQNKKKFSVQSKISSFTNIYQLKEEQDENNKSSGINNKLTLNISINSDDSFDIQQPSKRQKSDNSNSSNNKPQLPKSPYPSKKLDINNSSETNQDEDDYIQPTISNKNNLSSQNYNSSISSKTSEESNKINSSSQSSNGIISSNRDLLDEFMFDGNNSINNNNLKKNSINKKDNSNNNSKNNQKPVINNVNKKLINKEEDNQLIEEEDNDDSGYQQKNSKTFDISIKTDIEHIKKQYLVRNGRYDEFNNPVIPSSVLVFTNIDNNNINDIINSNNSNNSDNCCCSTTTIIDQTIPQLNGKFSNSIGGIGVKATQQQQQQNLQQEAELELTKYFKKEYFKQMIVIGQFNLGFIIAKLGNDLFIIDQHAADERYNFETLSKSLEISSQPLIVPDPLSDLTSEEEMIIIENIELFKKNGFKFIIDLDAPPRKKIKLSAFPMVHGQTFGIKDVYELIYLLKESPFPSSVTKIPRLNTLLASKACRKSIMVGTTLTHKEMKGVLYNLSTLDNPWICAHGRPTMRHLLDTVNSLKKVEQQQQSKKDKDSTR